jgi:flagellar biosynthesis repressor protein FlbT
MNESRHLLIQAGERIFINGAVVKFDRKVSIEILNHIEYLREHQVMQVEETTTPLRQLYFVVQTMMIDESGRDLAMNVYNDTYPWLIKAFENDHVLAELDRVQEFVTSGVYLEALRTLRTLFKIEDKILGRAPTEDRFLEAV